MMRYFEMESDQNKGCGKDTNLYANKIVLAPMVRENSLPFRLLCSKYGADLIYTEELIDHRLCSCRRLENKVLNTIDFVDTRGEVILRTRADERDKLILQLGSNCPDRALKVAKLVGRDVRAIDFNFGCPKSFSLKGGMGAAMLEKPHEIEALLTKCVANLDIPVTCKIRILPDLSETLKLVKMIESCGVSAIAVHGRTKDQRPHHENQDEVLRSVAECISIPMIANGGSNDIKSREDILEFKERTKASSVMIARAAMKNPSIFRCDNTMEPAETIIKEYLELALRYDNPIGNTKYSVQFMLASGHFGGDFIQKFHAACDYKSIFELFNLSGWSESSKALVDKSKFYDSIDLEDKEVSKMLDERREVYESQGYECICDDIAYVAKIFGPITPKAQLVNHSSKNHEKVPKFDLFQSNQHRYYCEILYQDKYYLNRASSISKRGAEQATSMIVCEKLGLVEMADYRDRVKGTIRIS